jgi:hypothetical protein
MLIEERGTTMLKRVAWAVLALAMAGSAFAQERDPEADEARPQARKSIKVLQHPYDIASFYRSSQGGGYFGYVDEGVNPRYPIASFYRSRQGGFGPVGPYGYSAFWTGGYNARHPQGVVGYRRSIGENGDVFLLVPTFLSPLGPLTGAFYSN